VLERIFSLFNIHQKEIIYNSSFWDFLWELVADMCKKTEILKHEYEKAVHELMISLHPDFITNPPAHVFHGKDNGARLFHGDRPENVSWYKPAGKQALEPENQKISSAILPRHFSLVESNFISPPKLQGFCNTCTAFAVIAALEAFLQLQSHQTIDQELIALSEQFFFFHSFLDGENESFELIEEKITEQIAVGWSITEALAFCEKHGYVEEKILPYNPYNRLTMPPLNRNQFSAKERIQDWSYYMRTQPHNIEWKEHLFRKKGGLIFSFPFDPSFYIYTHGVYRYHKAMKDGFGHAVLCVGYDDDKQAWHCKNSWGTHWGEQGFFWLDYKYPINRNRAYYIC